jgi:hypothetical protein
VSSGTVPVPVHFGPLETASNSVDPEGDFLLFKPRNLNSFSFRKLMFEDIRTMNCAHNNIRVDDIIIIIIIIIICSLAPREKYK